MEERINRIPRERMVYRMRVYDRYTDKELHSFFVDAKNLLYFVEMYLTKTTRIEIVDDYYGN